MCCKNINLMLRLWDNYSFASSLYLLPNQPIFKKTLTTETKFLSVSSGGCIQPFHYSDPLSSKSIAQMSTIGNATTADLDDNTNCKIEIDFSQLISFQQLVLLFGFSQLHCYFEWRGGVARAHLVIPMKIVLTSSYCTETLNALLFWLMISTNTNTAM